MTYRQKYYKELFLNLLEKAQEDALVSHDINFTDHVINKQDISSFYVLTLSILADSIKDVYEDMTEVYYSNKVDYALDTDLDDIGDEIGCPRPGATKAGALLTFEINTPVSESFVIPKGTIVSTRGGKNYTTMESLTITEGSLSGSVYAESVVEGPSGRVSANTLRRCSYSVTLNSGTNVPYGVTNPSASTGGYSNWLDEDYRLLLKNWVKGNIRGSREAYEKYFADFDGIDSYKIVPNWNGTGTIKIILDPGYPSQLRKAYEDITQSVCQFSEDITMFSAKYVPIEIYAVCNVDIDMLTPYSSIEKKDIQLRIKNAIRDFVDGDNQNYTGLKLGEDFIPYKLGVYLSSRVPELKSVEFKSPTEHVVINDEEIATTVQVNSDGEEMSLITVKIE